MGIGKRARCTVGFISVTFDGAIGWLLTIGKNESAGFVTPQSCRFRLRFF